MSEPPSPAFQINYQTPHTPKPIIIIIITQCELKEREAFLSFCEEEKERVEEEMKKLEDEIKPQQGQVQSLAVEAQGVYAHTQLMIQTLTRETQVGRLGREGWM